MKITFTTENLGAFAGEFKISDKSASILINALEIQEKAAAKWPDPNSLHEAYGLLREEFAEFEKEVFLKQSLRNSKVIDNELSDIICVCLRAAGVDILK